MSHVKLSDSDNFSLSSTTLSFGTETPKQSGGLWPFNKLFGASEKCASDIALAACKKGNFYIVLYLIRENEIKNFAKQDKDTGFTILHYLVSYYNLILKSCPDCDEVIDILLSRSDVKDFINVQDYKFGNTPLHLCVMTKNESLCTKLIAHGADKNIRNKNHLFIEPTTETEQQLPPVGQDIFMKPVSSKSNDQTIRNMVRSSLDMENQTVLSDDLPANLSTPPATNMDEKKPINSNQIKIGGLSPNTETGFNTDDFLDKMVKQYTNPVLTGGVSGQRQLKSRIQSNAEMSMSAGRDDELSRLLVNQATEIHNRTIKKIMELLGVEEPVARNYKAALYKRVQMEHPELNNLDRAHEMEKLATSENLKAIDIDKVTKEITEHIAKKAMEKGDKQDNKTEEKKTKKEKVVKTEEKKEKKTKASKKKKADETSDIMVTESSFSVTSDV
jgi:hypothetical protein